MTVPCWLDRVTAKVSARQVGPHCLSTAPFAGI